MPAVPSSLIEPLWEQFAALIPARVDTHPLGCHRPRIPDRVVFDKLIQVLVLGTAYEKIADPTCSATTIGTRRDEWITAGIFEALEKIALQAYDRIVGLDLDDVTVDGCIVKAPCGGQAAGRSPVDRGEQGTKRSLLADGTGIPLGCVIAGANQHDSPLLRPTLEHLGRFDEGLGLGLPETITVHLDAGYNSGKTRDLLAELGCQYTSTQLAEAAEDLGVLVSVGRTGVCWDNSQIESFWSTLKTEFYDRHEFATRAEATHAVSSWIETVYNRRRRHSALGQIPPAAFEHRTITAAPEAA